MAEITVLQGDCREILKTLEPESVHTVVTSPPYYGLRDYGTGAWAGGNDPACDHKVREENKIASSTLLGSKATTGHQKEGFSGFCRRCGAARFDKQIGLENTPAEYVATMVEVFREVWRVLRKDGTVWLNLGDTYSSAGFGGNPAESPFRKQATNAGSLLQSRRKVQDIKPKNLLGIPWRVAFALQADGYYLRSEIIWHKPNAMPESVSDRPTKAHETIFLLSKNERYYYDIDAIRQPGVCSSQEERLKRSGKYKAYLHWEDKKGFRGAGGLGQDAKFNPAGSNKRSVWVVANQPYAGPHFATFPEKLIEPCILAGCPVGGVVLDPFGGSGTTGRVAVKHNRNAVLIELNPSYLQQIDKRTDGVQIHLL
jgi:DNA modification methylase